MSECKSCRNWIFHFPGYSECARFEGTEVLEIPVKGLFEKRDCHCYEEEVEDETA